MPLQTKKKIPFSVTLKYITRFVIPPGHMPAVGGPPARHLASKVMTLVLYRVVWGRKLSDKKKVCLVSLQAGLGSLSNEKTARVEGALTSWWLLFILLTAILVLPCSKYSRQTKTAYTLEHWNYFASVAHRGSEERFLIQHKGTFIFWNPGLALQLMKLKVSLTLNSQ